MLLGQAAPLGCVALPEARRGTGGFHGAGEHFTSLRRLAQTLQRLAVIVEPLRIVGPALDVHRQLAPRVFILFVQQVHEAELPQDFGEKLPDGRPYPSGTAYEILTANAKRRAGAVLPDIYVFRYAASSPPLTVDDPNRERIESDWRMLKGFFQEWFLTEHGHFKGAFNPYTSEDDFEAQIEKLLRGWVAEKVTGGRLVRWPVAVKGSPFCGLAAAISVREITPNRWLD